MTRARRRAVWLGRSLALALALPAGAGAQSVNVIREGPGTNACVAPIGLPPESDDLNRQPQGEVWIDVSEGGRLAAAAKDYRFSPVDDLTYNNRVWNGLYVSSDGVSWRNFAFEDATPDLGLSGVTDGSYGRTRGTPLVLTHESDPVVAFDRDGILYTPPLASAILPGITRDAILTLAADLGLPVREETIPRGMLYTCDEAFFTGTAVEVTPIRSVDRIPVGEGRPGPVTRRLMSEFMGIVEGRLPDRHGWLTTVPATVGEPT